MVTFAQASLDAAVVASAAIRAVAGGLPVTSDVHEEGDAREGITLFLLLAHADLRKRVALLRTCAEKALRGH